MFEYLSYWRLTFILVFGHEGGGGGKEPCGDSGGLRPKFVKSSDSEIGFKFETEFIADKKKKGLDYS